MNAHTSSEAAEVAFLPTRRSLLSRLKDWDDQRSWRVFFETYWKLIYRVATKAGLTESEAQDVVQETVIAVAKRMGEFKYDPALGSFKGWLRQIAQCRIVDHYRKRERDPVRRGKGPHSEDIQDLPDPTSFSLEESWDAEWDKNLVDAAMRRAKEQVSARQYQIFDCYVMKQWPASQVAKDLRVNVSQVYLAKFRVQRAIKKELSKLQKDLI